VNATGLVLAGVRVERQLQNEKWGEQNHPDGTGPDLVEPVAGHPATFGMLSDAARLYTDHAAEYGRLTWADILREEFREALAEADPDRLRAELLQVAAVAVAWAEAIDRRRS
jgi:hypothetical protein